MIMTEVAFAVGNNAKIMIGAEGFEPLAGWSYKSVLEEIDGVAANGNDLKQLAQNIV